MTPAQRSLRARIGAVSLHASGGTTTTAATAGMLRRFEREVDPDGSLSPEERTRRAILARRAYMLKLSLRASLSRTKKARPDRDSGRAYVAEGTPHAHASTE